MAHSKKKRSAKRSTKGTHKRRSRSRRRSLRGLGDYDSANARLLRKESHTSCERQNMQRVAVGLSPRPCAPTPSEAKLTASENRAESKGCKAPKGKVCVDASVGRVKNKVRAGCKKSRSTPGTYICTEAAVKAHASGRVHVRGHRTKHKGYRFASWKEAINKSNGLFKPGCHMDLGRHRPVCKKASRKRAA